MVTKAIEEYINAWKDRLKEEEEEQKNKFKKARSTASRCSRLLQEDFGVDEVYIVGSSQNQDRFHKRSDLDLAVQGLAPEEYYQALSSCIDQASDGLNIDLIPLEDLSTTEKETLLNKSHKITRE